MKEKEMNRSFYDLVVKMRRQQKSYFATQDKGFLETSLKPIEREICRRLQSETTKLETAMEFRKAVRAMMHWQEAYFKTFSNENLKRARMWERYIDKWILKTEDAIKEAMEPKLKFE